MNKTQTPVKLATGIYLWNGYAIWKKTVRGPRLTGHNRRGGATVKTIEWRVKDASKSGLSALDVVELVQSNALTASDIFDSFAEAKWFVGRMMEVVE